MTDEIGKIIDDMAFKWPSTIVARKAVKEFTGGVVSQKYLANMDTAGTGPDGRFLLNNQIVYPVQSLVEWLKQRSAKSWQTRKTGEGI